MRLAKQEFLGRDSNHWFSLINIKPVSDQLNISAWLQNPVPCFGSTSIIRMIPQTLLTGDTYMCMNMLVHTHEVSHTHDTTNLPASEQPGRFPWNDTWMRTNTERLNQCHRHIYSGWPGVCLPAPFFYCIFSPDLSFLWHPSLTFLCVYYSDNYDLKLGRKF